MFRRKHKITKLCIHKHHHSEIFDMVQVLEFKGDRVYFGKHDGLWYELEPKVGGKSLDFYNQKVPTTFVMVQSFLNSNRIDAMCDYKNGVWFPTV